LNHARRASWEHARVAAADFRLLAGEELVSFYESTPGTHGGFCKVLAAVHLWSAGAWKFRQSLRRLRPVRCERVASAELLIL
jgi:hypothetical protein